ncbi:peptidylprolyl isomerase fpr4 [Sticta canariensis]|nr:peptidylprolyl isomerase fpr4 [Sticta canariensis]
MSSLLPVAVYGLKVPAGDVMVPASIDFPATFRITMAAIDPSATPEHTGTANGDTPVRATLKIIYEPNDPNADDGSEEGSDDENYLQALLQGDEDDEDEQTSSDEEEKNGGPSDPSKSRKARKKAAVEQMMNELAENDSNDDVDISGASDVNGALSKAKKGKGRATDEDEESSDEENEGLEGLEELVLCTLDPAKNYQQPLDLTVGEDQRAFFKVSGTHAIYLTGNYVIPTDSGHNHNNDMYKDDKSEEDYDLSPDEDELDADEESDELDDLDDPRITEIASEDDEIPKLTKREEPVKKGKNKRAAEESDDEPTTLDDIMAKSLKPAEPATNGEPKLSKKQLKRQLKKLKNNAGNAVDPAQETKDVKKVEEGAKDSSNAKGDRKVQFAKNLEQGPSSAKQEPSSAKQEPSSAKQEPSSAKQETKADVKADAKSDSKKNGEREKASLGPKKVQGVSIDDKKLGKGPAAKKGNKVGMRYIGKLKDGKVFDANKKGSPFTFTLGIGEVIKGWDIGVIGMSVGGERRITVPSSLAYGGKSLPGIPPNSELTFDVKLLEIK